MHRYDPVSMVSSTVSAVTDGVELFTDSGRNALEFYRNASGDMIVLVNGRAVDSTPLRASGASDMLREEYYLRYSATIPLRNNYSWDQSYVRILADTYLER